MNALPDPSPAARRCRDLVSPDVLAHVDDWQARFATAQPFRHVVIDGFFAVDFARTLLAQFPPFDPARARNEAGEIGNKAVVERIRGLGDAYAALDDLVQSREFLDLVGRITGIDALQYDPHYFGGGTHENRNGQDLDPHIDFNRHPLDGTHRRLNLIVYLNEEWHDAWGGSLDLHRDPRAPDDRIKRVTPLFNRCVIFETNEISWHGFSAIRLPPGREATSRRSIALYFYTRERPAEETADAHSTVYVDRPLPDRYTAGHALTDADVQELRILLARRDQHAQRLYRDIAHLQARFDALEAATSGGWIRRLRYFAGRVRARLRR